MSENTYTPSAEDLKNRKKWKRNAIIFLLLAAGIWTTNKVYECEEGYKCIAVDKTFKLRTTGFYMSVNGLSNTIQASASLVIDGEAPMNIAVESFENDSWGNGISSDGLSISGISVTDITDPIKVALSYTIPDIPITDSKKAVLVNEVTVLFPKLDGSDNMVDRTVSRRMSFSDVQEAISFETPVILKPKGWTRTRIPSGWFWLTLVLGLWYGLIMLGTYAPPKED